MKSMEYSHLRFIKLFILPLDKKAYENQHYTDLHLSESATFAKDYKSQMGILSWDFQSFDLYLAVGRPIGPKPRERSLSTEILPEILLRLFSESHLAVKVASPTEEGPAGWITFLVHGNQPAALGPHSKRKILETEYTVHRPYHKPSHPLLYILANPRDC